MLTEIAAFFNDLLGIGTGLQSLTILQIAMRALLIYLAGFAMLRFGEHRFSGKNTAFDITLGFIFGSLLSRAINGAEPLGATLLAGECSWRYTGSLRAPRSTRAASSRYRQPDPAR